MRDSITYKEILDEGRVEGRLEGKLQEARHILLRQGVRRLGVAAPETEARLQAIGSLSVLEGLLDRVMDVETWDDLLGDTPGI